MALWIELLFILVGMCNGAKGPGPIMSPHTDNFDDEEKSTTPSYTNGLFNITTNTDRVSHMSRNVQTVQFFIVINSSVSCDVVCRVISREREKQKI